MPLKCTRHINASLTLFFYADVQYVCGFPIEHWLRRRCRCCQDAQPIFSADFLLDFNATADYNAGTAAAAATAMLLLCDCGCTLLHHLFWPNGHFKSYIITKCGNV